MQMFICLSVNICMLCAQQRSEGGFGSLELELQACKSSHVDTGNQIPVLCKAANALNW